MSSCHLWPLYVTNWPLCADVPLRTYSLRKLYGEPHIVSTISLHMLFHQPCVTLCRCVCSYTRTGWIIPYRTQTVHFELLNFKQISSIQDSYLHLSKLSVRWLLTFHVAVSLKTALLCPPHNGVGHYGWLGLPLSSIFRVEYSFGYTSTYLFEYFSEYLGTRLNRKFCNTAARLVCYGSKLVRVQIASCQLVDLKLMLSETNKWTDWMIEAENIKILMFSTLFSWIVELSNSFSWHNTALQRFRNRIKRVTE